MPNGGGINCRTCLHFKIERRECLLRSVHLEASPLWTTCRSWVNRHDRKAVEHRDHSIPMGPMYTIVDASPDGTVGHYAEIPYYRGHPVLPKASPDGSGIIFVCTDDDGVVHEFNSTDEYFGKT